MSVRVDKATRGDERRLSAAVVPVCEVNATTASDMFALYASYYDGTSRALFAEDLRNKDFVLTLSNEAGELAGFSTLAVLDVALSGGPVRAIYSGDTIIDQRYWGTQALAFTWIRFAGRIKAQQPERPLFWFLIVKGHRTYRYLSTFSIDSFPSWSTPTPPWAQGIMDGLASNRFGAAYDPERGVVAFAKSRGHLKGEWAAIEPDELARPEVAFFLARNPGYVHGDELVCLTELSKENLRPLARRVFQQGFAG
jgi:hypothetical protein